MDFGLYAAYQSLLTIFYAQCVRLSQVEGVQSYHFVESDKNNVGIFVNFTSVLSFHRTARCMKRDMLQ